MLIHNPMVSFSHFYFLGNCKRNVHITVYYLLICACISSQIDRRKNIVTNANMPYFTLGVSFLETAENLSLSEY